MADNVQAPFTGTGDATPKIATDQIPGTLEHVQIIKIADGTADSTIRLVIAAEDAPAAGGEGAMPVLGVRNDSAVARTSTDGDFGMLALDSAGRLGITALGGTIPVSIAATITAETVPGTTGGYTTAKINSAASTNATSVKGSAGKVFGWFLRNTAAYDVSLKLFNKASAPTVGTDTPLFTIDIPTGAAANVEFQGGIAFGTGIAYAITKLPADLDTTVVALNDLVGGLFYK